MKQDLAKSIILFFIILAIIWFRHTASTDDPRGLLDFNSTSLQLENIL